MTDSEPETNVPAESRPAIHWWRIAGITLGALIAIIALLVVWMINDQDRIRRAVEAGLTSLTERQFTIAGDFNVEFGTTLTVTATNISWQNAAWSETANMLEVGWFSASVDVSSILNRPVFLSAAEARDVELWLEWQDDLAMNWVFNPEADRDEPSPPEALPLLIDQAALSNTRIIFRHPGLRDELVVTVSTANHQQDAANNLVLDGELMIRDRPLELSGRIGPFPELAVAGAIDFDLLLTGELARLTSKGQVEWLAQLSDPQVALELTAPDAKALLERLELPVISGGDIDLKAQIDMRDDNIDIDAAGNLGEFLLDANIKTTLNASLENLQADVESSGPSARRLLSMAGIEGLTNEPYQLKIKAERIENILRIDSFRFDTESLNVIANGRARADPHISNFDLSLQAAGKDVRDIAGLFGLESKLALPFSAQARIKENGEGANDILDANFRLGEITASISGQVTESPGQQGSRLKFNLQADDVTPLSSMLGFPLSEATSLQLDGDVQFDADRLVIYSLDGQLPASNFSARGDVAFAGTAQQVDLTLDLRGTSLGTAVRRIDPAREAPVPNLPFNAKFALAGGSENYNLTDGKLELGSTKADFNAAFDFSEGGRLNLDFSAAGDDFSELFTQLDIEDIPAQPFSGSGSLVVSDDAIAFRNALLNLPNGQVAADIDINNAADRVIDFDVKATGTDLAAALPAIDNWEPKSNAFNLAARGRYAGDRVRLDTGTLAIGDAQISAQGKLTYQPALRFDGLKFTAKGPRLSDFGSIGGATLTNKPFSLAAGLTGSAQENDVEEIELKIGRSDLHGDLDFNITQDPSLINARLRSDLFDTDDIYVADDAEGEAAAGPTKRTTLLSDEPLPLRVVDVINGSVRADFARLEIENWTFDNVATDLTLKLGDARLNRLSFDSPLGRFEATGESKHTEMGRDLRLNLKAYDLRFTRPDMSPADQKALPLHTLDLQLTARGNTTRELGASANGYVWIVGGPGRSRRLNFGLLFGDFATELLSAINPIKKPDDYSNMECQNLHLEIKDGVVTTSPAIAIQTDNIRILADGKLNLANEKIDFGVQTSARKGVGISVSNLINPFTKVSGTILKPRISIDEQGALVQGGAAFATAGLSLFADTLWKRWISQRDICSKVGEQAIELRRKRNPEQVPDLQEMERRAGVTLK